MAKQNGIAFDYPMERRKLAGESLVGELNGQLLRQMSDPALTR
ncbi:hypothetical protein [Candidatus Methylacidithermus pantelleriae]|nr:hypothetical protein [Candidatus Methylacidithermus pantelleriae]